MNKNIYNVAGYNSGKETAIPKGLDLVHEFGPGCSRENIYKIMIPSCKGTANPRFAETDIRG